MLLVNFQGHFTGTGSSDCDWPSENGVTINEDSTSEYTYNFTIEPIISEYIANMTNEFSLHKLIG